jgi:hypothetical protein
MRPIKVIAGLLSAFVLHAAVAGDAVQAEVRQAPSSRVAIDVPAGFVPARQYTGFVNEAAGTSLVVVELPAAAYEQLASGLTPEALAKKGIAKAEPAKLAREEPYLFMRGEQASGQGPVAKFLVAFRDKDVTALITANVQKSALERGAIKSADVEQMLASATLAPQPAPAREVFRLGYLGPFLPAGSILGTTRAYTLDGKLEPAQKGEKRAVLIVAPSLDQRQVDAPEQQAEALLGGLPGLTDLAVVGRRKLEISGMETIEILGQARDNDGADAVALYQALILPKSGGYYRIVGQMPSADKDVLIPEMRKIAESFRVVE